MTLRVHRARDLELDRVHPHDACLSPRPRLISPGDLVVYVYPGQDRRNRVGLVVSRCYVGMDTGDLITVAW